MSVVGCEDIPSTVGVPALDCCGPTIIGKPFKIMRARMLAGCFGEFVVVGSATGRCYRIRTTITSVSLITGESGVKTVTEEYIDQTLNSTTVFEGSYNSIIQSTSQIFRVHTQTPTQDFRSGDLVHPGFPEIILGGITAVTQINVLRQDADIFSSLSAFLAGQDIDTLPMPTPPFQTNVKSWKAGPETLAFVEEAVTFLGWNRGATLSVSLSAGGGGTHGKQWSLVKCQAFSSDDAKGCAVQYRGLYRRVGTPPIIQCLPGAGFGETGIIQLPWMELPPDEFGGVYFVRDGLISWAGEDEEPCCNEVPP